MSLVHAVADLERRTLIADDAVDEARRAIGARRGMSAMAARLGMHTIEQVRPGFLERHVSLLLPAWAEALDPHWSAGDAAGDAPGWLAGHADEVAADLLAVSDAHAERAGDPTARGVYQRLRPHAATRIAAEMPRISAFVERWSTPLP